MAEIQSPDRRDEGTGELDLIDAVLGIARHWRLLAIAVAAGLALGFAYALVAKPIYESRVTILPEEEQSGPGILGAVAAVAGMDLQGSASYEDLYGRIVDSDWMLDQLLARRWPVDEGSDSLSTFALLGMATDDGAVPGPRLREKAKRKLRGSVLGFYRDGKSGFMILSARLPGRPVAAAAFAEGCAERLDYFNREIRSSKAHDHRVFCQSSLASVGAALEQAEGRLATFLEENRSYASSPDLMLQYGRLKREVEAQTTVWAELRKQYELALVDEDKSTVSLDILDHAQVPVRPVAPRRIFLVVLGGILGGLAGFIVLAGRTAVGRWRTDD